MVWKRLLVRQRSTRPARNGNSRKEAQDAVYRVRFAQTVHMGVGGRREREVLDSPAGASERKELPRQP
jgi:hypothetical protein